MSLRVGKEIQALPRRSAAGERLKSLQAPQKIHVVAGVLIDRHNRVLIAQRPQGKALAGAWEFPGGKLEPGEEPKKALERELAEELGLGIRDPRPLVRLTHRYDHARVLLDVWVVRRYHGRIEAREDQALKWVRRSELHHAPLLPADRPIPKLLRLPERLRSAATRDYRVLRLGSAALERARARARASRCAAAGDAVVGAAADPEEPLLGALCRSPAELRAELTAHGRAARCIDFFVLARPCTDEQLALLCAALPAPLYASGLALEHAWSLGASGVASIV